MTTESIAIPAERVPPVARDMASSSKSIAGVLFFLGAIVAIGALGALGEGTHDDDRPKNSAEAAGNAVGAVLGAGIIFGVPGWLGFRAARNASRATRAASVAKTDPSYTWRLAGKYIIAADGHDAPPPELSFKINGKLRTMLLALPRANVVGSS